MTVVPFLNQNQTNEITGLMMAATSAIIKVASIIPLGAHPDTFKAIFADAQRTAVLDACIQHLCGYNEGLANFLTEAANETQNVAQPTESTQRVTESVSHSEVPSPILIDETRWQAAMDEIRAIILAPYNGGAGLGYDPMNEIGLALAKHLNVIPVNNGVRAMACNQ
ncbi:hypothetical protein QBD01_001181 [Ochrobactrum sp. 19YEA23]|uniref:hypothetical protein n=1 Tax=Ochrobactrum sp. 19YEA23 TaxID=3039854 RepID=UPI00247B0FB4|nr:hypothetical protein [Ochrobactrum sp. 19YEA23]